MPPNFLTALKPMSIGKGIHSRRQALPLGEPFNDSLPLEQWRGKQVVKPHQQTACDNRRNDWHENVTEHLNEPLDRVAFFLPGLLILRPFLHIPQLLLYFGADQVHGA